jgi:hypothetical protein
MKAGKRDSCPSLFRVLNILPFYSQIIFLLFIFVAKNMDIFIPNSDIHRIHTTQGLGLHYPIYKLAKAQKGVFYTGIMIFNNLPHNIKILSNDGNKFQYALKHFCRWAILNGKQGMILILINNNLSLIKSLTKYCLL